MLAGFLTSIEVLGYFLKISSTTGCKETHPLFVCAAIIARMLNPNAILSPPTIRPFDFINVHMKLNKSSSSLMFCRLYLFCKTFKSSNSLSDNDTSRGCVSSVFSVVVSSSSPSFHVDLLRFVNSETLSQLWNFLES